MGTMGEDEYIHDRDLTADERVVVYVLTQARNDRYIHTCEQTAVSFVEGDDGSYGCDTGCEFWRLEAKLTCEHFPDGVNFTYGEFGMLYELLERI